MMTTMMMMMMMMMMVMMKLLIDMYIANTTYGDMRDLQTRRFGGRRMQSCMLAKSKIVSETKDNYQLHHGQ
eukprot:9985898-Karenia_brevis.AAC.1